MPELDQLLEIARSVGVEAAGHAADAEKQRRLGDSVTRALARSSPVGIDNEAAI